MAHTPLDFLQRRLSVPSRQLGPPGPDAAQLDALLALAVRVPDHGRLTPWRFIRIAGDTRRAFGMRLADLMLARDPAADPAKVDKERNRYDAAPLVLAVVATITPNHKIPEQEQLLSAGLAAYNLLLGAQAMGFGAQWLTGWAAYDAEVGGWFGLAAHERIVALVHIGTPHEPAAERPRADAAARLSDLALPPA
jgi:nitroreductase